MASRRERAAARVKAAPPSQLESHCFNVFGWAMKTPTNNAGVAWTTTFITAYTFSTSSWEKTATGMENKGENPWRSSLSLTPQESSDNGEAGTQRYLLVGFTAPGLSSNNFNNHPSQKKQTTIETQLAESAVVSYDGLPLMVVTPVQESEQPKVDLFVLLRPNFGLCSAYHVDQKDCFYLPVFRDGTTDLKGRGPAWNQLVATQALRPSSREPSSKQKAFKRARNTSKIVLEPKRSLVNEISLLAECYQKSGEMWHLAEMAAVLEEADEDLSFAPPVHNTAMRNFIDNEKKFEEEDSGNMVKELYELWPELEGINATDLKVLKDQLVRKGIILECRLIRPFLAEACFQIQEQREGDVDGEPDVAENVISTIRRVLGNSESAAPIDAPSDDRLIETILLTLKNVVHAAEDFDKKLKDNCGDQSMTGTLHDIWEKYADALDTDTTKMAWFAAARYLTAAMKHKQRGVVDMLKDMIEILEEMKLNERNLG